MAISQKLKIRDSIPNSSNSASIALRAPDEFSIVSPEFVTVKMADKIIVLQNGQITEQGPHKTLLSQNSAYAQWFEKQCLVNT